jgi:LPXTG-motif cell wall-anchored protein
MQGIFDDETLSTRSTSVENYKILAYPVQIRFKDSDLTTSGDETYVRREALPTSSITDSSSASDGTSTPTSTPDGGGSGGLSTGAQVGIGVGVGLGVLILIIAAILFWRRRRRYSKVPPQVQPQPQQYQEYHPQHQIHEVESSPSQYGKSGYYSDSPRFQDRRAELSG